MVWFRRSGWRHSATTLLSRKISNYIAALFIVAIVIPWVGFASLSPTNRSQQIGYAANDLQTFAAAYAEHLRTAVLPEASIAVPDWLAHSAKLKHTQLSLLRTARVSASSAPQVTLAVDERNSRRFLVVQATVPGVPLI